MGVVRMLVVQTLARVLFQMQTLDADRYDLPVGEIDKDGSLAYNRLFILGNLIASRQVGIEIILPVEDRNEIIAS